MTPWMDLQTTANYLSISKETVYRLIYKKKIPVRRIGKKYIFNKFEINKWLFKQPNKGPK